MPHKVADPIFQFNAPGPKPNGLQAADDGLWVIDQGDSVFNVALGLEQIINEGLKAYLGFNTDFSSATENQAANLAYSQWDLYHIGGGATFNAMGTDFTLGTIFAFGSDVVENENDQTFPPVGLPDGTDMKIQRITLILGFNFGFD